MDQMTTLAESLGCSDALQSMSDDEGDEDDADEAETTADISTSETLDSSDAVTSPDSSKASLSDASSPRKPVSSKFLLNSTHVMQLCCENSDGSELPSTSSHVLRIFDH